MYIKSTNSTNTLMKEMIARGEPIPDGCIYTGYQTAGRGQTGNGWESEADKNLLCSILLDDDFLEYSETDLKSSPFFLNVLISVALHRQIGELLWLYSGVDDIDQPLSIKWPNDIYYGDKKLAGILIEGVMEGGRLKYAIAGIGLNVNQTEWHSGAPNPISMRQIRKEASGMDFDYDVEDVLVSIQCDLVENALPFFDDTWKYYKEHLYRREGFWRFVEREVSLEPTMNADSRELQAKSQEPFLARIKDVLPTGEIVLEDQEGQLRTYHFKQVRYVI